MKYWKPTLGLIAGLAAATQSCGSDDDDTSDTGDDSSGGGGGASAPRTVTSHDEYLQALPELYCDVIFNCPVPNDDSLGSRAVIGTVERCEAYLAEGLARSSGYADLRQALESGRVGFDPAAAGACLEQAALVGAYFWLELEPCRSVYTGTVTEGGECFRHEECVGDAYCGSDTFGSCPGICAPRKPPGSACNDDVECDATDGFAECDWQTNDGTCVAYHVRTGAALGESCGHLPGGEFAACACGLWCDAFWGEAGSCQEPIPVGTPCSDIDHPCAGIAYCTGPEGAETCQNLQVAREEGAPCDDDTGLPVRICDPTENFACVNGACQYLGDGSLGSGCEGGDLGELICEPGLYCDEMQDPSVCAPLRQPGDPCDNSSGCEFGCDYDTDTCATRYCGL